MDCRGNVLIKRNKDEKIELESKNTSFRNNATTILQNLGEERREKFYLLMGKNNCR